MFYSILVQRKQNLTICETYEDCLRSQRSAKG